MTTKTKIMDEAAVDRAMARITHEVIERNQGTSELCILGVKRRGIPLAERLCENIRHFEGIDIPFGWLDVTVHRDDLSPEVKEMTGAESQIPCDINGKNVLIVDDVLYTGRTVRAAIETVFSYGRPKTLQLVVLIDRGHRELPIRPDYVGKNLPTSKNEKVRVLLTELDGETGVYICTL